MLVVVLRFVFATFSGILIFYFSFISSYSKAFNVTHVAKWENGKVVKSEMSWKALF